MSNEGKSTEELKSAYDVTARFVDTWEVLAESLPFDYGCTLTCSEAEALADLFRAFERPDSADALMRSHAEFDDPGDEHYEGDDEDE